MSVAEKIYITVGDYRMLNACLDRHPDASQAPLLAGELARAEVVSDNELPSNVVTLLSRAQVLDEMTAKVREVTVVRPGEPDREEGKVSVLAPLGAAVIGLSEGQTIDWSMPSGRNRRFRVVKVLYQPEADRRTMDVVDQASMESFPASDAPGWRL